MASVFDVASYICSIQAPKEGGNITTWKLQKLVYYAQAWSVVWDDCVLFDEPIEAWANGPVVPALYEAHKGQFKVSAINGNPKALADYERETIDVVLESYGHRSAHYLSELTHSERPWIEARAGLAAGERGHQKITPEALGDYYGGLVSKS